MKQLKIWVLVLSLLAPLSMTGGDKDERACEISFVVIRDHNEKPVRNASVVLRSINKKGKPEKGGQQLKTDASGKTQYPGVPYGTLRVQVLAPGLQTYGEDFVIDQPKKEIVVRLKRPQEQYSIYDKSEGRKQ